MNIYNKDQIKKWDNYTIEKQSTTSLQLMEKASNVFVTWLLSLHFDVSRLIIIFAGSGNNGGDGFAIGRILHHSGFIVQFHFVKFSEDVSLDCQTNFEKARHLALDIKNYNTVAELKIIPNAILIDAILGSGLSRPVTGQVSQLVSHLNTLNNLKIAVDIPSGLHADKGPIGSALKVSKTLSFEVPKLSFFLKESNEYLGAWDYRSIDLSPEFHSLESSNYQIIQRNYIAALIKERGKFEDKSKFGFGHLCGGSKSMAGAMILGSKAALRAGIGRLIVSIPQIHRSTLLISCPEAMLANGNQDNKLNLKTFNLSNPRISSIAAGPGLGTSDDAVNYIDQLLSQCPVPLILDADALNIIARNAWQNRIPKNSILTPHEREFSRLFGETETHLDRINLQQKMAKELDIVIILKGAHSSICSPNGMTYFNMTGNVGMAKSGSGDVLTGVILSFLSQGYTPILASQISVYLHGLAGDLAAQDKGIISLIASDIIDYLPKAIKNTYGK